MPWIVRLWLLGAAAMLLKSARCRWQLRRILAASTLPDEGVGAFYLQTAAGLGVTRKPRLLLTRAIESPALVGLLRPRILVPAWLAVAEHREALAWSLRHELTHWKHGDAWLIRLRELGEMLFFFHPAAWWAGRRLGEAMELACDRAVIASEADAVDYAQRLYQILEMVRDERRQPVAGGLFATRTQIARRFAALVQHPLRARAGLSAWSAVGLAALTIAVLSVGAGVRRDARAEEEPPPNASPAPNAAAVEAQSQEEQENYRVLHFPAHRALGMVYWRPRLSGSYAKTLYADDWRKIGAARGDIRVRADADVRLDVARGAANVAQDLSPLAALDPDDIQAMSLLGHDVSDDGLKLVGRLTDLRVVDLNDTRITDAGVRHLANLKRLQGISLMAHSRSIGSDNLQLTDAGIAALAGLPKLEVLSLIDEAVTDAGLRQISGIRTLKHLWLTRCPITDEGLARLAALENLEFLGISQTQVRGEGFKHLENLRKLTYAHVGLYPAGDLDSGWAPSLQGLGRLSTIKELELDGERITNEDLAQLSGLLHLETLKSCQLPVNDKGAFHLAGLASLKTLWLDGSVMTDQGLLYLTNLRDLEDLRLSGNFSDEGLEQLARLKSLRTLQVSSPFITDEGLEKLVQQMPSLRQSRRIYQGLPLPFVISEKDRIRRFAPEGGRTELDALEGHVPPPLRLAGWMNAGEKKPSLEQLRGKVVLIAFSSTWPNPADRATAPLKVLYQNYHEQGLVVWGIYATGWSQGRKDFVAKNQIPWPVARDVDGESEAAWHVPRVPNHYPFYYLIDRAGTLRMACIYREDAERAVVQLLSEAEPAK